MVRRNNYGTRIRGNFGFKFLGSAYLQLNVNVIDIWQTCFELRNRLWGRRSNQRIDVMPRCVEISRQTAQGLFTQRNDCGNYTFVISVILCYKA